MLLLQLTVMTVDQVMILRRGVMKILLSHGDAVQRQQTGCRVVVVISGEGGEVHV